LRLRGFWIQKKEEILQRPAWHKKEKNNLMFIFIKQITARIKNLSSIFWNNHHLLSGFILQGVFKIHLDEFLSIEIIPRVCLVEILIMTTMKKRISPHASISATFDCHRCQIFTLIWKSDIGESQKLLILKPEVKFFFSLSSLLEFLLSKFSE